MEIHGKAACNTAPPDCAGVTCSPLPSPSIQKSPSTPGYVKARPLGIQGAPEGHDQGRVAVRCPIVEVPDDMQQLGGAT